MFSASLANRFKELLKLQGKALVFFEEVVEVMAGQPGCDAVLQCLNIDPMHALLSKQAVSSKVALIMESDLSVVVKRLSESAQNEDKAVCWVAFTNECLCLLKRFNGHPLA